MVSVTAYPALRPPVSLADAVAAPPYDVINAAEAREIAGDNPDCFLRVSLPEIGLPADAPADTRHRLGAEALADFVARGVLVPDGTPTFTVYRLEAGDVTQTGLVGLVSTDDYDAGLIAVHEFTRPDKENDRTDHIQALSAHDEPVFLMYRDDAPGAAAVAEVLAEVQQAEPSYTLTRGEVTHTLWVLSDPAQVAAVEGAFTALPRLYVADGHHRCAASARVAHASTAPGAKFFPALICAADELNILGYHRVVRDLAGRTPAEFRSALTAAGFALSDGFDGFPGLHEFGLYLDGAWTTVTAPSTLIPVDAIGALDVSILQDRVLAPLLDIADPRTDARIAFVGGSRGTAELERLVDSGEFVVAFALHPTSAGEVMTIADAGDVMPPKSTWFEPKPVSGLFVHRF